MRNVKDVSSLKLHRDWGKARKTTRFVNHRLRRGMVRQATGPTGKIEVDETYIGGKRRNMNRKRRKALAGLGRGAVGMAIVTGAISRDTGKVVLQVIPDTGSKILQGFVDAVAQEGVIVCTDEHKGHAGLDRKGNRSHETVNQSKGEYVKGCAGTNRMESIWVALRRASYGIWHNAGKKRLSLHILEAAGRHNMRQTDIGRGKSRLLAGMAGQGR